MLRATHAKSEKVPFTPHDSATDDGHEWAAIQAHCDLSNDADSFLLETVTLFREAYGEPQIIGLAADPSLELDFDLAAIRRAIRTSYPDPEAEGDKPAQLTNYRSEPTEILARGALRQAHNVAFPVSPQLGKSNANQPILGFDGWGFLSEGNATRLVLVQVKGTQDTSIPPREAQVLCEECRRVPREPEKIARALCNIVIFLGEDSDYKQVALYMLERLGEAELPSMAVAPVVVRGEINSTLSDLDPIRLHISEIDPVIALGVSLSVGAELSEFGRTVIERARSE